VHGLSRFYDHNRFKWTDERWSAAPLAAAILYELHIGTFTPEGTFDAAIGKLDHLVGLGITCVELMPIAEFPGSVGWGYDGVDLFAPHHAYGGPDGFKRFVDACHAKGLAVVLDVVYNHLGPDGNYLGLYGWYYTDRYKTPWGDAINFDGRDNDEVRRLFLDNALMWLNDYHLDGLRLDAVHAIIDLTAMHFLEQLALEVDALKTQIGRRMSLIAESDLNDPKIIRSREIGGYGLDAQWNDDFRHSLWTVLSGESNGFHGDFGRVEHLAKALANVFVYDGWYSSYRHRRHGRNPFGVPRQRFLAYLQNHDQVGNRAEGDRMNTVLGPRKARLGAMVVFTSPFVPMLFMGEEWDASTPFQYFTDHQNQELAEAVRKGRIQDFGAFGWEPNRIPDPQAPETALRSKLDWSEVSMDGHAEMLDWYRMLINLRRQHPSLSAGDMQIPWVQFNEGERWLYVGRQTLQEKTWTVFNFSSEPRLIPHWDPGEWRVIISSAAEAGVGPEGAFMPPESGTVFLRIG
jgi:maltooligosyltrehalose trehalohydrolase